MGKAFKFVYIPADTCVCPAECRAPRPPMRCSRLRVGRRLHRRLPPSTQTPRPAPPRPKRRRSEPLQQWELELQEGREVEVLIDRLKAGAGCGGQPGAVRGHRVLPSSLPGAAAPARLKTRAPALQHRQQGRRQQQQHGRRQQLSATPTQPLMDARTLAAAAHRYPVAPTLQEHFAASGPKKTAAQIKAQQADLMSKLPEASTRAPGS